jgi:hypoxanthine-guanine phosphoribosyltransferase
MLMVNVYSLFQCVHRVASLLEKRTHRSCGFKADYVGFSVPDE